MSRGRLVLLAGVMAVTAASAADDVSRYKFSCRGDATTFVLDTVTGRVWRYDRVDDAWYLYDLEALVGKSGKGRRSPPPEDPPAAGESGAEER